MPLSTFHPAVTRWFLGQFGAPTQAQAEAFPAIARGEHALIAAPTGSGKTLAAFLGALDALVREGATRGALPDETRVVYVSPLRALSHDIELNLQRPLAGIAEALAEAGLPAPAIRTWVRTGDTPQRSRAQASRSAPHVVVTTPESLYVLLTSDSGRRMLRTVERVIVDEIHALARDKRGAHLALSLERLECLVHAHGGRLQRIGLSATQRPIETLARFLVGAREAPCTVVDTGHQRERDLALLLPRSPLDAVMSNEVWSEVYEALVTLIAAHRTTLVFVNTRRTAERVARALGERLGQQLGQQLGQEQAEVAVTSHHGSLSREKRLDAEQRLKAGRLRALVATASLELGIDVGDVDLVCQLGSPRAIATFLQRVGRSGHNLAGTPKGRLVPLSRDDLVECAALLEAVRAGDLDRVRMPEAPLDVLAQQVVAAASAEDCALDELYAMATRAHPYRALARETFDRVVAMLADGFSTRRGRRAALVHLDAVNGRLRGRRGARLTAMTSGGAIPDNFDYQVLLEPDDVPVGTVHEDFAIESMAGEVFQLGNASYRIKKAEPGILRVEDARGQLPSIPFWVGEAPGRTDELSAAVSALRTRVEGWLAQGLDAAIARARGELAIEPGACEALVGYLAAAHRALGALPTTTRLVLERFFDETDAMHLVLHAPFGSRVNRAFGLALRKRFCRSFNVELQAAASDDAILLSLGPMHSFALEEVFGFLKSARVRDVLVQALLTAPVFGVRFRWNASRALAIARQRGGKKVAPRFQRMAADDLMAAVFPEQVACAENLEGEREVPDHPLVNQTVHDCLTEAMDIAGLEGLLAAVERGEVACVARDLTEPSPLAHEILNARPYAFLDDAPLEERRTQAVMQRRWLDPRAARDLGALDPDAIRAVVDEARPDAATADELHDALCLHGALPEAEGRALGFAPLFEALVGAGRAAVLTRGDARLWVAAERIALWQALGPLSLTPALAAPRGHDVAPDSREEALRELVRGRLEATGPVTADGLSDALGLARGDVDVGLALLETEGFVLRGSFRADVPELEWCARRLLARIHRRTLDRLRSEIEPVAPAVLMRFLLLHQHATPGAHKRGVEGLLEVVAQLAAFDVGAVAWEQAVLPLRVADYAPGLLDALSLGGRIGWARSTRRTTHAVEGPVRATPIALYPRADLQALRSGSGAAGEVALSLSAQKVRAQLAQRGACFPGDLEPHTGLVRGEIDEALGELIAQGLVTSDGFAGLRRLVETGRARLAGEAGRYGLLAQPEAEGARAIDPERWARVLLARWGVVFRALIERESTRVPWLDVLRALRTLEARGEVRAGRFVAGFSGEQYALPDAVSVLRRLRREPPGEALTVISGADPLNLAGIITPGPRIPQLPGTRILLCDGIPVATRVGASVRFVGTPGPREAALYESALRGGGPTRLALAT